MAPENGEIPPVILELTGDERATLHRMAHQLDEMHQMMREWKPVIEAYRRGGMLGARNAARNASRRPNGGNRWLTGG